MTDIGDRVRLARTRAKLSQERLAHAIGLQDLRRVLRVETGKSKPSADFIANVSVATGADVRWLLWGDDAPIPPALGLEADLLQDILTTILIANDLELAPKTIAKMAINAAKAYEASIRARTAEISPRLRDMQGSDDDSQPEP